MENNVTNSDINSKNSGYILVIDSGNGGEYTLHYLRKFAPKEHFIMFKDVLNSPYGTKTIEELKNICEKNINILTKRYNVKMIILACNTLSTTVLKYVRKKFRDVTILGVTPNIKRAVRTNKKTLVLSTTATLKLGKIDKDYIENLGVKFVSFDNLAKMIDDNLHNLDSLIPYLDSSLKEYKDTQNVVLGCTHYNLIKSQLKKVLNEDIVFYENSNNVAKTMKKCLVKQNLLNTHNKNGKTITITKLY